MLEKLIVRALYKTSSRKNKKNFVLNEMESTLSRSITGFYTCLALREIVERGIVSRSIFHEYQIWLRKSIYFDRVSMNVIHVSIDERNYHGKMNMFNKFLQQYEGEL